MTLVGLTGLPDPDWSRVVRALFSNLRGQSSLADPQQRSLCPQFFRAETDDGHLILQIVQCVDVGPPRTGDITGAQTITLFGQPCDALAEDWIEIACRMERVNRVELGHVNLR